MSKESAYTRTTVWIPRGLHEQAKIMAILTRSSLSRLMISALTIKIKELKKQNETNLSKRDT